MKKLIVDIKKDDEVLMSLDKELSFVSFGDLDRGDISDTTNWGVYSNVGEIEFFDKYNNFVNIFSENPSLSVCIYYKSYRQNKLLYTFKIDDYEKNHETKIVSVKLKDEISEWQNQSVPEYYEFYPKKLSEIFEDTLGKEIEKTEVVSSRMNKTTIGVSYMEASNKWRRAEKFCQASMSRIFCLPNGKPVISDEKTNETECILINPKNVLSFGEKSKNEKSNYHISEKNYGSNLYKPALIYDDGINFSWFSVTGTTSMIIGNGLIPEELTHRTIVAKWQNSDGTSLVEYPKGEPIFYYKGARFFTNTKTVDHIFDAYPKSIINVSSNYDGVGYLIEDEKISIYESDDDQKFSVSINKKKNNAEILFEYYNVFDDARIDRVNHGYVGNQIVTGGNLNLLGAYFSEDGEELIGDPSSKRLESNELIQKNSLFETKPLAQHIVEYSEGKYSDVLDCVVVEVTPSDYYSDTSNLIIGENGEKPLFEKYDVVVPYVVRNGLVEPYSTMSDGSPKKFKIIGIQYYYKGFLKQKLYLQENVQEVKQEPVTNIEPSHLAHSINETEQETIFVWAFEGLNANKKYNMFCSFNNSILAVFSIHQFLDRYSYFLYNQGTIKKYPISKKNQDCLILNTELESDENGKIYFGLFYRDKILVQSEAESFIDFLKNNTNYIYLS